jgi:hypothetical protein
LITAAAAGAGNWIPTGDELGELTTMLARFCQLATTSMQQSLSSMEKAIERVVGSYLTHLADPTPGKGAG